MAQQLKACCLSYEQGQAICLIGFKLAYFSSKINILTFRSLILKTIEQEQNKTRDSLNYRRILHFMKIRSQGIIW